MLRSSATSSIDPADVRVAAVTLLAAGAALPLVPGHPSFACPLRTFTGVPCPLCGMTTSVEATVRLDLGDALAANPAGVVAVVVAILLLALRPARIRFPAWVGYASLAAMWAFELHRFSFI